MRHENEQSHVYDSALGMWVGGNFDHSDDRLVDPTTTLDLRGDKIVSLQMGINHVYAGILITDYKSCCQVCALQRPPSSPPIPPSPPRPPVQPPYPPQPPPTPTSPFTVGKQALYATAGAAADMGAIAAGQHHECKGIVYQGSWCHLKTHYDVIHWPTNHVAANQEVTGDFVFAYAAPVSRNVPHALISITLSDPGFSFTLSCACGSSLFPATASTRAHRWRMR